jgi:uncharacterized caspase-like protein
MCKFGLFLLFCFFSCGTQAQTDPIPSSSRVALVIGNASYLSGPLKNTVNDARAMAQALRASGFEVILSENVPNQNEMKKVVREFGMKLRTGGTALFYYSGHGMQVKGFNYLIPTQAVMNIEQEIEYEALDVGFVLAYMESARSDVNIVILDACRNNPFARAFRDTKQGLSSMVAPTGTLIAYSTSPGSVASDGEEEYGLYTKALLRHMTAPGMKVEDVFKNVRAEVLERSKGTQIPWESSSLVGDFYFNRGENALPAVTPALAIAETPSEQQAAKNTLQEGSSGMVALDGLTRSEDLTQVIDRSLKRSGTPVRFKWRSPADGNGTYFLKVDGRDISAETKYQVRGEHVYVYHPTTHRVYVLKYFFYRMDGTWHSGKTFE